MARFPFPLSPAGALALALVGLCGPTACGDDGSGDTGQDATGSTSSTGSGTTSGTSSTGSSTAEASTGSTGATSNGASDTGTSTSTGSSSGSGSGSGSGSTGGAAPECPPTSDCFFLPGVFHEATEQDPVAKYDIPLPNGKQYSRVEVELDFVFGGWYPDDPAGLHNIFWLHRGKSSKFTWMGGVIGYVNTRGPNTNILRTRHDLDVTDLADSHNFNVGGLSLIEGHQYHVLYRYDAAGGEVHVELGEDGQVLLQGNDVPTTNVVTIADGGVFIWFGNGTDVELPGPEVPSLDWVYSDLRIELIP